MSKLSENGYDESREPCGYGVGITTDNEMTEFKVGLHLYNLFEESKLYSFEPATGIKIGIELIARSVCAGVMNIKPIRKRALIKLKQKFNISD
jgi:hypothetical protein